MHIIKYQNFDPRNLVVEDDDGKYIPAQGKLIWLWQEHPGWRVFVEKLCIAPIKFQQPAEYDESSGEEINPAAEVVHNFLMGQAVLVDEQGRKIMSGWVTTEFEDENSTFALQDKAIDFLLSYLGYTVDNIGKAVSKNAGKTLIEKSGELIQARIEQFGQLTKQLKPEITLPSDNTNEPPAEQKTPPDSFPGNIKHSQQEEDDYDTEDQEDKEDKEDKEALPDFEDEDDDDAEDQNLYNECFGLYKEYWTIKNGNADGVLVKTQFDKLCVSRAGDAWPGLATAEKRKMLMYCKNLLS